MKSIPNHIPAKRHLLLYFLLLILCSCSEEQKPKLPNDSGMKIFEAKGIVLPEESLKPPKVVVLDTMPKPLIIEVPSQPGGSYTVIEHGQETKIDLFPPVSKPAGYYYFMQHYTTDDGLAVDHLVVGFIDSRGNLWFGSAGGGLSKYDGKAFTNISKHEGLAAPKIFAIMEDKKGNLWFGTDGGGVSKYNGKFFINYTVAQGLSSNIVSSIVEDKKGNLWFGTANGISEYNGETFSHYSIEHGLPDKNVSSILEDKIGNLWFGTSAGVSKYDGKAFTNYTKNQGLVNNSVTCMLEDKKGHLWFGTSAGVSKYDGKTFTNYTVEQGLVNNVIHCLLEDMSGNIWFGTVGGASQYDGKVFINFTTAQGLASNLIISIVEDKIGSLWFCTEGSGVCRYDGPAFTNYTKAQGLPSSWAILEDRKGNFWIGTHGDGVILYDRKTFTFFTIEQGLAHNNVRSLYEDNDGNLWFGTEGGVSKYDGRSFTNYTTSQGLINNKVRGILKDKAGNLWFGTTGGASTFNGKSFTNYTTAQGLAGDYVSKIVADKKGDLWFCTRDGGVSKHDGKTFTNYSTEQGLASKDVINLVEDLDGNLWFATTQGLSRFDGKSFMSYSTQQGLPDNMVYYTIITKEQDILVGTNLGIAILTGFTPQLPSYVLNDRPRTTQQITLPTQNSLTNEELQNYTPVFEIYNSKRGYPVKDSTDGQYSIYLDSQGIIWLVTGSNKTGLVRFDYGALHKTTNPPQVFIQNVKIDNENISWYGLLDKKSETQTPQKKNNGIMMPPTILEEAITSGNVLTDAQRESLRSKFGTIKFDGITKWYPVPENLTLPYIHNNITFDFAAIEPDFPQDVLYQYKLEGYDRGWSSVETKTSVTYGNIYEGSYQFKVKAQSPFAVWSQPITYTFKVLPPWYRTWWAYSIYAIFITTFFYLIYLWRTATLRERQRILELLYKAAERFVPKQFLNLLKREHITDVKLGDSTAATVTVLFTDIRGFTTFVEKLTPDQAYSFINGYFKYVVPVINAQHGFITEFQGDGIVALFPKNADDAIDAVLGMAKALVLFNEEQFKIQGQQIQVGYGLHTGPAMLGTIGVPERMEAKAVSDTINSASRVENLNKFYGTGFLISDATLNALINPKKYIVRLVDKIQAKGKKKPIRLYEVYKQEVVDEGEQIFIHAYEEAFQSYEKGDLVKALEGFKKSQVMKPADLSCAILIERCESLQKSGLPPDWDGTYAMTHK